MASIPNSNPAPPPPVAAARDVAASLVEALGDRLREGIVIQGEAHSFHHRAAGLLLPGSAVESVRSFPRLAQALSAQPGRLGLMAIENSVAGALLTNYLLLEEHDLRIVAEVYLRISHAVLAPPGSGLEGVRTIESHPMALRQCRGFLRERPWLRPVESYDTAGAAAEVARAADPSRAAVAPAWCADAFGLVALASGAEDNPHNWTRFVLVSAPPANGHGEPAGFKTSVAFSLDHTAGSLAEVLTLLAARGCSLTKIQSLPVVGRPWEYRLFCDFTHEPSEGRPEALVGLARATRDLTYLGTYVLGQHHEP